MMSQTIQRIEVFPVGMPVTRSFTFASGSAGRPGELARHVFVKITDSEGLSGWGAARPMPQWSYETLESVVSTLRDYLGPAAIGLQICDVEGLEARMFSAIGRGPSTGQPIAKSALDLALWDLRAKAAGIPLRCLLGGSAEERPMRLSWTCTAHTAEEMKRDVAAGLGAGFQDFNFKAAVDSATDVQVATALSQEAGNGSFLWADCNQGLTLPRAVQFANRIAGLGIAVLEQPLPADQFHLMAELRSKTALPLAVDESSVSDTDFFRYAAAGLVDYLVVKLSRSAGITPTLRQIAVARSAGLSILVSGLTDCFLTKLASLQAASSFQVKTPAALNGSQFMDESRVFPSKGEMERGGIVYLGSRPGIGCDPDEASLRELLL